LAEGNLNASFLSEGEPLFKKVTGSNQAAIPVNWNDSHLSSRQHFPE